MFGRTSKSLERLEGSADDDYSQRDKIWESMTEDERIHYLATTKDTGNKRYEFPPARSMLC